MTKKTTYEGVIQIRAKGTGFVSLPDFDEDIMIPTDSLSCALDGDVVELMLERKVPGKRREGRIVRVIEQKHKEFIGRVEKQNGSYRLTPDNRKIHVHLLLPETAAVHEGMKAVARIEAWKNPLTDPIGAIVEVLGPVGDHETEMQAIVRSGGFSQNFPTPVAQAAQVLYEGREQILKEAVNETKKKDPGRRDMRDRMTCTIDPKDAKDFDDAISIRILKNSNIEIGIHIADVSHYVQEDDVIDREAQERGTSVYLVDRVISMLPEVLSNDLCSLKPDEDRLAFSAVFEIQTSGKVEREWFGQTIIRSDKRFTYEEAGEVLKKQHGSLFKELRTLMEISRILRKERHAEGAIAFDQPEVVFELDKNGKPISVHAKERVETMLMIEDYMLLANRRVAEFIYRLSKKNEGNAAFVYRIHDVPNPEKIEELSLFLHALGYEFKAHKGVVSAHDINRLLKEIEGTPEENLIKTATIRSMAKAIYTTKNIGHFGLAFKYYTHFTSPIRRYPDLMAHRLLRRHLNGSHISGKELSKYEKLSIQSSEREMTAVQAERDSIKYKQVEFMQDKVGEEFEGIITGVTDWGLYVEEKNSRAEGLIRLASMKGDFFMHEASKYRVRGEKSGRTYSLGGKVRMKLVSADMEERQLGFELLR